MNNSARATETTFSKNEKAQGNTARDVAKVPSGLLYLMPLILQTLVWIPTRIIFKIFLRFKVHGIANVDGIKKPVIFAVNHSSEWDPILVPAALPFLSRAMPMFYTSRERNFYEKNGIQALLYGGLFFKMWGAYPVKVGVKNYERALRQHIKIIENRAGSICFFPEGAKTKDGNLSSAKGGVSYLAQRTRATIVPVAIHGHFGMSKRDFFLRRRKVTISFGEPIPAGELFENRYYDPHEHKAIAQIVMSKITQLKISREPKRGKPRFAFLVHPRNVSDVYRKFPALRYLPKKLVEFIFQFLPPIFLGHINGLPSTSGGRHDGILISLPITSQQMLNDRTLAVKKIRHAVRFAKRKGAEIIGLGSLTSLVVRGGLDLVGKHGVYITNGNALTAAMTIAGVREVSKIKKLELSRSTVAVIGATGSVGQAVSRILVRDENIAKLILVGKTPEHLARLREKVDKIKNGSEIVITANIDDIKTADLIIVATSASGAIVQKNHLKHGAIVYDITQPQNVPESIREERPDVLVIDGAIVELPPETGHRFDLGVPQGTAFACMAETMIIAAEDTLSDFSIGHVELDQVDHMLKRATHHEFKLARLHSWGAPLQ